MNPNPTIIFEDEDLLVLDKPPGMAVDALQERYPAYLLAHRLDRETSGVMVMAKNEMAHARLKKQFQRREVKKTYRAFVYGTVDERGTIDKPIGSSRGGLGPRSAHKPYGTLREATTLYRRIKAGRGASYVEVFPKTGRTHQIRVHFAAIQHPVVADRQYAPTRQKLLGFERLALHAYSLSIIHPSSQKELKFEAPLPPDFIAAEGAL